MIHLWLSLTTHAQNAYGMCTKLLIMSCYVVRTFNDRDIIMVFITTVNCRVMGIVFDDGELVDNSLCHFVETRRVNTKAK